jgi:hypothetical protein
VAEPRGSLLPQKGKGRKAAAAAEEGQQPAKRQKVAGGRAAAKEQVGRAGPALFPQAGWLRLAGAARGAAAVGRWRPLGRLLALLSVWALGAHARLVL